MCHHVFVNDIDLWHERLGHLNYKILSRITSAGVVRGLPTLGKQSPGVYGPCQVGKQLKSTHKAPTRVATAKVLELLHINLMGPM